MKNSWQSLPDGTLYNVATQAHTTINAALPAYGCTAGQMTALSSGKTALDTSITAWESKRAALEAETQTKLAARQSTIDALISVANTIYANAGVTDAMLSAAGYAIHDTSKTKVIPQQVVTFNVTPDGSGNAFLKWGRNGNPQGVMFVIEQSPDGTAWTQVQTTTRAKTTINGLVIGVPQWFRVRATKSEISALPSDPISIWNPGGEGFQLSVAA